MLAGAGFVARYANENRDVEPWSFLFDWTFAVCGLFVPKYMAMQADAVMANLSLYSVAEGFALLGVDAANDQDAVTELCSKMGDIIMSVILSEGAPGYHVNPGEDEDPF